MTPPDPLCTTGLSKRIYDALCVALPAPAFNAGAAGKAFSFALASAIYTELTTAAVVAPTMLVAPSGGGPVTGTGAIT